MSKKLILALISMLLSIHFASAIFFTYSGTSCITESYQNYCTYTYIVNASSTSPVAIMISSGYWGLDNISLPAGCTQKLRADDIYNYSTAYFASCMQAPGLYTVTAFSHHPSTYIAMADFVFAPGTRTFTANAVTTTTGGATSLTHKNVLSLCAGASGNGVLQVNNDSVNGIPGVDSDVWFKSGSSPTTCSESTPSPPLTLIAVGVS